MKMSYTRFCLLSVTLLTLASCSSTQPQSNIQQTRERLSGELFDAKHERSAITAELKFGRDLAAKILHRYPLYDKPDLNRYINLVGKSVARNSNRPELTFRFAVLDTEHINAYATPGGYIFITRGALEAMHDESELAAVLAHEIAHVTEKHIVNELNIRGDANNDELFSRILSSFAETSRTLLNKILDQAEAILFNKGLKKSDEFQADQTGTLLLTSSEYDPVALRRYLSRIAAKKGKELDVVLHTHPGFGERINRLNSIISKNGLDKLSYKKQALRFKQNTRLN